MTCRSNSFPRLFSIGGTSWCKNSSLKMSDPVLNGLVDSLISRSLTLSNGTDGRFCPSTTAGASYERNSVPENADLAGCIFLVCEELWCLLDWPKSFRFGLEPPWTNLKPRLGRLPRTCASRVLPREERSFQVRSIVKPAQICSSLMQGPHCGRWRSQGRPRLKHVWQSTFANPREFVRPVVGFLRL